MFDVLQNSHGEERGGPQPRQLENQISGAQSIEIRANTFIFNWALKRHVQRAVTHQS